MLSAWLSFTKIGMPYNIQAADAELVTVMNELHILHRSSYAAWMLPCRNCPLHELSDDRVKSRVLILRLTDSIAERLLSISADSRRS